MLTLIQEKINCGSTITFDYYEFVSGEIVVLYGDNLSFIVIAPSVELKLHDGGCFEEKYPILYDTVHGPLTEESMQKYGVHVRIICMDQEETYVQSCVNMIRAARKCKPEIVEGQNLLPELGNRSQYIS